MRKKIAFLVTKSNFGGAQRYVYDVATSLPTDTYDVVVIGGAGGILTEKLKEKGVRSQLLPSMKRDINIWLDFVSFWNIFKIIKRERPDIIHLNSPKAAGFGAFCGKLLGVKKIIYTVHGFAFNEDRNALEKFLIKLFSWFTILLSHHAIFLSDKEMNSVSRWPFIKKKLFVIPLGIKDIAFLSKEDARAILSKSVGLTLSEDDFIIGTIAELHPNKGLSYAVEALSTMTNLRYIIIGDGQEKVALEKQIKDLGCTNIHLAGRIESAANLLKGFDAFLLPSIKEGLPYVLLEAGFSGIPVIATRVGGIPELIQHDESGILIEPKHPDDITNAVSRLRTNVTELGKNLESHVKNGYSLQIMLKKLTDLYTLES